MKDQYKKKANARPESRADKENLPSKLKDTPRKVGQQKNEKPKESIQGEWPFLLLLLRLMVALIRSD